jgi:hypothetical protein
MIEQLVSTPAACSRTSFGIARRYIAGIERQPGRREVQMADEYFSGFEGWPEGPGNVDLRVGNRLFDLHNNANLLAICHQPAQALLEFRFAHCLDWEKLGGPGNQEVSLRFVGVRRLRVVQEDDVDVRAARDFDGVTYEKHDDAAQFVVQAAHSEWRFTADRVVFVPPATAVSDPQQS